MKFLGVATSLDSFLKAYKTNETGERRVFGVCLEKRAYAIFSSFFWNIWRKRLCSNIGENAENDWLLPQQRVWDVKSWMYIYQFGHKFLR